MDYPNRIQVTYFIERGSFNGKMQDLKKENSSHLKILNCICSMQNAYCGPTNIRRQSTKFSRPDELAFATLALLN
jgi:hypothetical protein